MGDAAAQAAERAPLCSRCTPPCLTSLRAPLLCPLQAYIDFEIGEGNREGARELYERLLQRTRHVKVCARRRCCCCFSRQNLLL